MKCARIFSVAVAAMFIIGALAVTVDTAEAATASKTADFSNGAYIELKDVSQSEFEKLAVSSLYISETTIINPIFSKSIAYGNCDTAYKYDSVSLKTSKYYSLADTKYISLTSVNSVSFKNLEVTYTFKNAISDIFTNSDSFDGITDLIKYFGKSSVSKGDTIKIKFGSYSSEYLLETSSTEKFLTDRGYLTTEEVNRTSSHFTAKADIVFNEKTVTADFDMKTAVKTTDKITFTDEEYTVGTTYAASTTKVSVDGQSFKNTYGFNGKSYDASRYAKQTLIEIEGTDNETSSSMLTSSDITSIDNKTVHYNDLLYKLTSDDAASKLTIEGLGGNCNQTYDSAVGLADSVYDNCRTSGDNGIDSTLLILAIIIIAVIILAAVILIRKH